MKKLYVAITMVFSLFFFQACLAWGGDPGTGARKKLLNDGFVIRTYTTASKKYGEDTVLLSLSAKTKGQEGDGYVVANFYKEVDHYGRIIKEHVDYYFLPERQYLPLNKNFNYKLNIARAYRLSDDGSLIVGQAKWLRINGPAYSMGIKTLPLDRIQGDFKLMYSPRIINRFQTSEIIVKPRIDYAGLKAYCDFNRSGTWGTETFVLAPEGGAVKITADMTRCYALSFIEDGDRVIQTRVSSRIYFKEPSNKFDEEYGEYMEEYMIP